MNLYPLIKVIHIASSFLLVGTGFGSAFYLFFANRSHSTLVQAMVGRWVVRADWWFTTPTVILQPITGFWLASLAGWSWNTPWIRIALGLYLFAGLCWLPVVWLQIQMAKMAQHASETGTPLPPRYRKYQRCWEGLGYPAFTAMLLTLALMVYKPGW